MKTSIYMMKAWKSAENEKERKKKYSGFKKKVFEIIMWKRVGIMRILSSTIE